MNGQRATFHSTQLGQCQFGGPRAGDRAACFYQENTARFADLDAAADAIE
jgi:hypothetical protein